jgi:hypothetical protein
MIIPPSSLVLPVSVAQDAAASTGRRSPTKSFRHVKAPHCFAAKWKCNGFWCGAPLEPKRVGSWTDRELEATPSAERACCCLGRGR